MLISAGTRLGKYEITAPLGAGAMGEVYRARDSRLSRDVALKVLPAAVAGIRCTGQLQAVRRARSENANTQAAIQWLTGCGRAGDRAAIERGLKASIPKRTLDGLVANASVLSPAAVLAMVNPG